MNNQWEMGTAHPALVGHVMVPRWWNESKHRGYFNPTTQPSISSPKYKATRFLLLFGALPTLMTEQRLMPRRPTAHSPRWQPVGESQHGESHGESGRFFLHQLSSVFFTVQKLQIPMKIGREVQASSETTNAASAPYHLRYNSFVLGNRGVFRHIKKTSVKFNSDSNISTFLCPKSHWG